MNAEAIRRAMFDAISVVAPEADPETLSPDDDLREALDIDSMDFIRYVTKLHQTLGLDVPEADYPKLYTLARGEAYLAERLASV
jgi:acyl carrier protein